jgi:hypothetical protein
MIAEYFILHRNHNFSVFDEAHPPAAAWKRQREHTLEDIYRIGAQQTRSGIVKCIIRFCSLQMDQV